MKNETVLSYSNRYGYAAAIKALTTTLKYDNNKKVLSDLAKEWEAMEEKMELLLITTGSIPFDKRPEDEQAFIKAYGEIERKITSIIEVNKLQALN